MPDIVLDSGPAFALFHEKDPHHVLVRDFIRTVPPRSLITNVAVLTETAYLLGRRARQFLHWTEMAVIIDESVFGDLPRIRQVLRDYADQGADFADASLLALCERLSIKKIATIDARHFSVYRTHQGDHLDLVLDHAIR